MESESWVTLVQRFERSRDVRVQRIVSPASVVLRVRSDRDRERKASELAELLGLPGPELRDGMYRTITRGGLQVLTRPDGEVDR